MVKGKKANLLQRTGFGLALTACAISGVLSGCYDTVQRGGALIGNRWVDRNRDGAFDVREVDGLNKRNFYSHEEIFLGNEVYDKKGSNLRMELYSPNGHLLSHIDKTVTFNSNITHSNFSGDELKRKGGTGEYTVRWLLDGTPINQSNFILIN